MEQAIISLVGFGLALTIYLDRACRADMRAGFARIDDRFDKLEKKLEKKIEDSASRTGARFDKIDDRFHKVDDRFDKVEKKLEKKIEDSASRTDARINELNRSVIELAQSVGRAEGRTEVLTAVE
ncbi:MAG: hypothetical protein OXG91_08015 [bacterium]|nr:hypothetical protein [bacterium]